MELTSLFYRLLLLTVGLCHYSLALGQTDEDGSESLERFKVEGIVERPTLLGKSDKDWFANIRIYTHTGHSAFLRENGSFVLHNLAWGAHFVHVVTPSTVYAPIRIDINNKGKFRLRRVDILQPSKVDLLPGQVMRFTPLGPVRYFQVREQWRITDLLFNPMVLMTVVPLALLLIMPKFSDADTRKEVEERLQMPKPDAPDLSEIMTNFFKGGAAPSSSGGDAARRSVKAGAAGGAVRGGRRKDK